MAEFTLNLPDFDEADWKLWAIKGYMLNVEFCVRGDRYMLNFFQPVRLAQDVERDLERCGVFFMPNLIVIPALTKSEIERAAKWLAQPSRITSLMPQ